MFIRSQNRITIINMNNYSRLYAEQVREVSEEGAVDDNLPFRIYADCGGCIDPLLGEYEDEDRAICVLNDLCGIIQRVQPNYVYFMPAV